MSNSLNVCNFIGNVGKIETRYAPSGDAICNLSLAVNEEWKDKNTSEKKEHTEWIRVVFFGKIAEIATKYIQVGALIYVSGKLSTRKWQNKDKVDQYTTEIKADVMKMLGSKSVDASAGKAERPPSNKAPDASGGGFDDDFDSVPF